MAIAVQLLSIMAPLLTAGLGWIATQVSALLTAKIKNTKVANATNQLLQVVIQVVMQLAQTVVPAMKAKSADGKLTAQDIDDLRDLAIKTVTAHFTPAALAQLAKDMGASDVTVQIVSMVENIVFALGKGIVVTPPIANTTGGVIAPDAGGLPPFYQSDTDHPAQQGLGIVTPGAAAPPVQAAPVTAQAPMPGPAATPNPTPASQPQNPPANTLPGH